MLKVKYTEKCPIKVKDTKAGDWFIFNNNFLCYRGYDVNYVEIIATVGGIQHHCDADRYDLAGIANKKCELVKVEITVHE